ncbi:putative glycerol-1-phosphate prenyltransferase [Seinonella peptonophila]|uniref:Putative glycerol-1-phosphate prenyltransferase n=1 Tax=Seinonella peptonophila TaxID=112248 RepID=A0A1M5AHE6_9BACL|nr:heptaprenylglyceryl phosphate synthase [Seinonella peptonophila]SHF29740.1 putative glycerol-1-phosphate prenyltransferase [Seinonella peptonophila]
MLDKKIRRWRHVFKLDPNRMLSDLALEMICKSDTDAIIIGGTDGITYENTQQLLDRVRKYPVFCVQEISKIDAVVPGFDGYLIPAVLNSGDTNWFLGAHHQALKAYGDFIPWNHVLLEGYLTCNPEAKVSRVTKANTDLTVDDCVAYVRLADRLYRLPIFYIEYSGTFGDVEIVKAARSEVSSARLFYGGGLTTEEQVKTMAPHVDTIVVGNLIYFNAQRAVQTVAWVKKNQQRKKVKRSQVKKRQK